MSNKIKEIRARHKRLEDLRSSTYPHEIGGKHWTYFGTLAAHDDRATLLAEVDRQRAEIERLKQEPELLRAELISLTNAARKSLADSYDRAREARWRASHE